MINLLKGKKVVKSKKLLIPNENVIESHYYDSLRIGVAVVKVTPKLATHWLQLLHENQRALRTRNLAHLKESAIAGDWVADNGATIVLDVNGTVIDGQHRLVAVVETGVTLTMVVCWNCQENSIVTIDTGASRTLANILRFYGVLNYTGISGMANSILSYESCGYPDQSPSKTKAVEFAMQNQELLQECFKQGGKAYPIVPSALAGFLYYYYKKVNAERAVEMFRQFKHSTLVRSNAIDILKNRMVLINGSATRRRAAISQKWRVALVIKAFNAYFCEEDITPSALRWSRTEKYPRIIPKKEYQLLFG